MSTLDVLTRDGFQALEAKQSAYALQRLDAMLLELRELDDFLTDCIDRHRRGNTERKESIHAL